MGLKRATIVLVDDDETLVEMFSKKIKMNNFNLLTANDGKKGFKIISNSTPDIVLLDLVMPKWDGFELFNKIKNTLKNIPVIAFTNLSDNKDKKMHWILGFMIIGLSQIIPRL